MRRLLQDVLNSEAMRELTSEMFPEAPQRRAAPPPPPMMETSVQPPVVPESIIRPFAQPAKMVTSPDIGLRRPIEAAPPIVRRPAFSLGDRQDLRRAIVIREVLDLPIALRKPEDQTYNPR